MTALLLGVALLFGAPHTLDVKKTGAYAYTIEGKSLDALLEDQKSLAASARIVPNYKSGQYMGFKMVGVRPGSMYRTLGIRSGDVIRMVNHRVIRSPNDVMEHFFGPLARAKLVKVTIERRGRLLDLEWTIEGPGRKADKLPARPELAPSDAPPRRLSVALGGSVTVAMDLQPTGERVRGTALVTAPKATLTAVDEGEALFDALELTDLEIEARADKASEHLPITRLKAKGPGVTLELVDGHFAPPFRLQVDVRLAVPAEALRKEARAKHPKGLDLGLTCTSGPIVGVSCRVEQTRDRE